MSFDDGELGLPPPHSLDVQYEADGVGLASTFFNWYSIPFKSSSVQMKPLGVPFVVELMDSNFPHHHNLTPENVKLFLEMNGVHLDKTSQWNRPRIVLSHGRLSRRDKTDNYVLKGDSIDPLALLLTRYHLLWHRVPTSLRGLVPACLWGKAHRCF